ncbi:hypothetical protein Egran_04590 [Elaphomyces granulatus]|uniref:non-specific serine/threonine protein kinase n=1 Tax=Elaphomyces granulatus TaxID=519963 RepID=A0A232LU13_9EURO|nr:hypothetical protein Egran_04590 [Elaphomyces granulatus]
MGNLCEKSADDEDLRKFYPSFFYYVENLEKYEPGGLHPTHLGEVYDNGRYKIVHKLGFGHLSTVWLAHDLQCKRYVALKIVAAKDSQDYKDFKDLKESDHPGRNYIASSLDCFWLQGPNGYHLCLVSHVLGPSISRMLLDSRLQPSIARSIALQATQGLAYLHSQGICHGNFTTSNVLFQLSINFDSLSEEEVYALLGKPQTETVKRLSGEPPGPSAPIYVVDMPDFANIDPSKLLRQNIRIIDFDQSFYTTTPPTIMLGIPSNHMAPESIFDLKAGVHSDIWALGCAIFRLRAGYDLFDDFGDSGINSHSDTIRQVVKTIGRLPAAWSHIPFDEDGLPVRNGKKPKKESRMLEYEPIERPLLDSVSSIEDEPMGSPTLDSITEQNNGESKAILVPAEVGGRYRNGCSELFWRPPSLVGTTFTLEEGKWVATEQEAEVLSKISHEEAISFHDLLSRIFTYDPMRRISAKELSRHPWFTGDFMVTRKRKEEGKELDRIE